MKQDKKIVTFFSQPEIPEILVATAINEESYTDALEFRLINPIMLIMGKNASLICNIHTPPQVRDEVLCFPNIYPCIRSSIESILNEANAM